jgi:ketosteroid isomerase-like protein
MARAPPDRNGIERRKEVTMTHARLVQDWLEGWNMRNLELLMSHYAEDAMFASPSVLVRHPGSDGRVNGKAAIRELYRRALESFPNLRFEVQDIIERTYGVIVIHRKLGVFAEEPGFTVEVFEINDGLIHRNTVYWGLEEIASRFVVRQA